jgi:hypothetical protein
MPERCVQSEAGGAEIVGAGVKEMRERTPGRRGRRGAAHWDACALLDAIVDAGSCRTGVFRVPTPSRARSSSKEVRMCHGGDGVGCWHADIHTHRRTISHTMAVYICISSRL